MGFFFGILGTFDTRKSLDINVFFIFEKKDWIFFGILGFFLVFFKTHSEAGGAGRES
jgi:hypothetical protein